jgi:hypothetical protein
MRTAIPLTVLVTGIACSLFTASAQARARVFVASYGNDSNPCTFASPCRNFQQAVNVVDFAGEVTAIDSAGFGPINIIRSVTITSPAGVEAGIAAPAVGGAAITINGGGASVVTLSGLTLDGARVTNSTGISFTGTDGLLTIRDCVIRNFDQDGIDFFPTAAGGVLSVSNTVVSDNGNAGIAYYPSGLIVEYAASITLNRVEMRRNSNYGLFVWGAPSMPLVAGAKIVANVLESTVSGGDYGFYSLTADGHTPVRISLFHSLATGARKAGLHAEGGGGHISIVSSMVTGNGTDWEQVAGGAVESFGDNSFLDNTTSSGPPAPLFHY